jgi:hypothetical protein
MTHARLSFRLNLAWDYANMTASASPTNNSNMAIVRTSEVVNTHALYFHIYILELRVNITRLYILITVKILDFSSYFFRKSTVITIFSITPIGESWKLIHIIKQSPFFKIYSLSACPPFTQPEDFMNSSLDYVLNQFSLVHIFILDLFTIQLNVIILFTLLQSRLFPVDSKLKCIQL